MRTSIGGILERFDQAAQDEPQVLAVLDGEVALTRTELSLRAAALAAALTRRGVGRGDRGAEAASAPSVAEGGARPTGLAARWLPDGRLALVAPGDGAT